MARRSPIGAFGLQEPLQPRERFFLGRELAVGLRFDRGVDHLADMPAGPVFEVRQNVPALNQRRLRFLLTAWAKAISRMRTAPSGKPGGQRRAAGMVGLD